MSVLEQNTTKKGQVSKKVLELDAGNEDSKEYEVEAIQDSAVYVNKSESGHLPGLSQEKKYLETIVSSSAPQQADQFFSQKSHKKTKCNFSAYWFYSANNQA